MTSLHREKSYWSDFPRDTSIRPALPTRKQQVAAYEQRLATEQEILERERVALAAYSQALEIWAQHGSPKRGKYANMRKNAFSHLQAIYDAHLGAGQ